ncbi:MAG: catalase [Lachnospiraceae bacterium]|nr:catalase [Lachnospiraceae bacterium]
MKLINHFSTITRHKIEVMKNCFRSGLYWQGITHDLSKYSPTEFLRGVKYYQGNKSPNDAERRETGMSRAWLHHKGRNKHHFEYWIDYDLSSGGKIAGLEMPVNYVVEMVCDRIAACKIYKKDEYTDSSALEYFEYSKGKYIMHPETEKLLRKLLVMLAEEGEDVLFDYMKYVLLKKGRKGNSK